MIEGLGGRKTGAKVKATSRKGGHPSNLETEKDGTEGGKGGPELMFNGVKGGKGKGPEHHGGLRGVGKKLEQD